MNNTATLLDKPVAEWNRYDILEMRNRIVKRIEENTANIYSIGSDHDLFDARWEATVIVKEAVA